MHSKFTVTGLGKQRSLNEQIRINRRPCVHRFKNAQTGTSLVVQWLSICLPIQGTRVRSLVGVLRCHMLRGN